MVCWCVVCVVSQVKSSKVVEWSVVMVMVMVVVVVVVVV